MSHAYEVQEKGDYLLLTASGVVETPEDLMAAGRMIMKEVIRQKCLRLIIDNRSAVIDIETQDLIAYTESMLKKARVGVKVAVVHSLENLSKLFWIETILQNRSISYRQFSAIDEAKQWLLSATWD